jgi:NADPH2 dehydrogenase
MSKYFHYQTIDDLRKDIAERGLNIHLEEKIDRVLQPVKIGNRVIGNALGFHPMEGCDGDPDGSPGPLTFRRWERFGEGGGKLIWGEATAVYEDARANPRQLLITEKNLSQFEELARRTKQAHIKVFGSYSDLLVGLQLTHSGRYTYKKPFIAYHHPDVDALTYLDKNTKNYIPADYPLVTDDYLERLEDQFLKITLMVEKVGFDFVDIKQCHTYLLSELLGARTRPGKYGGSFENRTRFIRNLLEKIKSSVGRDFIIASRINAYDGVPYRENPKTGMGEPVPYPIPYPYSFGVNPENPLREDLTEVEHLLRILVENGVSW